MNNINKAVEQFRNPYSCAQTIYAAFKDNNPDILADLKTKSGGQAPDNMCGALYSALQLLPENLRNNAIEDFLNLTGSTKCSELKLKFKTPCQKCVRSAAEIVDKYI